MPDAVLAAAAATYGVVMGLAPVLQIRRMIRKRSSRDVSTGFFGVLIVGFVLWIAYGLAIENLALVVPNTVALIVAVATIMVARIYRRPDPSVE
jgi:MtN3 and saliva related transmembrane protein